MPALTLAITTFSRVPYLERMIRGVPAREFTVELLILNNSSTDGVDELIRGVS
jgi:hypothetical protein